MPEIDSSADCDVAVIGGGPAGSTLGCFLKKYNPDLSVRIYEAERFPRDHVGESQLPNISEWLDEIGVWDKVEAAGFPIKIGGTFKWGHSKDLWHFTFFKGEFEDLPRPGRYAGRRTQTAFQVDRAVYDKILLDHAEEMGCEVYQGTGVVGVETDGDRVLALNLLAGPTNAGDPGRVTARYYVDASGHRGVLRTAFGVPCEYPTALQNVAFWGYWQNAQWAEKIGVGGTRVQIMSLPYGWVWLIPISETRSSVGLVTPAKYYKESKMRPADLYERALKEEPRINHLLSGATYEGRLSTTKDWSFVASRIFGENWLLAGESAGFADPILSAGMTITQACARDAAFTLLELDRGEQSRQWLLEEYQKLQISRIRSHIRFADFWYTGNGQFEDLKEYTREIARANGLDLTANDAWSWLAGGGFIDPDFAPGTGTFHINAIIELSQYLSPIEREDPFKSNNVFKLDLSSATLTHRSRYDGGRVTRYECYERAGSLLPLTGAYEVIVDVLRTADNVVDMGKLLGGIVSQLSPAEGKTLMKELPTYLWAMVESGWVRTEYDPSLPKVKFAWEYGHGMAWHEDRNEALRRIAEQDADPRSTA